MDYKQELKTFFKDNCLLDEPMARHTTYRTGGKAEVYVYPKTREEWNFVLKLAETENIPLRIIGFGSNILVSGKGIGGIVCSTKRMNQVTLDGEHIKAEAGAALDKVCEMACEAGLAGMEKIPAIIRDCEDHETAALGLLENIQRADLNPFEQARGLQDILALWDCTQAEAARRLGMAQPTLANKLRLLQLTPDQQKFILDNRLTERHARAVLRLPDNRRSEALIYISAHKLNARATDRYVEQLLNAPPRPPRRRLPMVKDVRIFVNTIDHAIRLMTDNGVPATARREEGNGYIEYTVRIPTGTGGGK